ncbi:hypothetical protein D3C83_09580 [compost metagenome]
MTSAPVPTRTAADWSVYVETSAPVTEINPPPADSPCAKTSSVLRAVTVINCASLTTASFPISAITSSVVVPLPSFVSTIIPPTAMPPTVTP